MKMGETVLIRSADLEGIAMGWTKGKPGYINVRVWIDTEKKYLEFDVHPTNLQSIYRSGAALEINNRDPEQGQIHFACAYDLALLTNDKEWFDQLTKGLPKKEKQPD